MPSYIINDTGKYTDDDVRANPILWQAAVDYALNYKGRFHFLQECKWELESYGNIGLRKIRGILNCILFNERELVKELPKPGERWPVGPGNRDVIVLKGSGKVQLSSLNEVQKERLDDVEKQYGIGVKVKFKHKFIWTTNEKPISKKTGVRPRSVFHTIDPNRAYATFWPRGQFMYSDPMFEFFPTAACGIIPQLWTTGDEPPPVRDFCGTCQRRGVSLESVNDFRFNRLRSTEGDAL